MRILSEAATSLKGIERARPVDIKALIEKIKKREPPDDYMKILKAAFIAFPASDFEASMIFYRDLLDLPIVAEGFDAFSRFAHFDCGGFGIHLYEWTKPFSRAHTGLQLYVSDVDALHQELASRGVKFSGSIRDEPWGGRVVTVSDPDGNLFDLLNADYEQKIRN